MNARFLPVPQIKMPTADAAKTYEARAQQVLDYIQSCLEVDLSPTFREIAKKVGVTHPYVQHVCRKLIEEGRLARKETPAHRRTQWVIPPGSA